MLIRKYSFLILDFLLLVFMFQISYSLHKSVAFVLMLILFEIVSKTGLSTRIVDRFNAPLFFVSMCFATFPLYLFYNYYFKDLPDFITRFAAPILFLDCVFFAILIFFPLSFIIKDSKGVAKKYFKSLVGTLALSFMVIIYLPLDSFIGNIDNFEFPIQRFIGWQLLFCIVVACFAATLLFLIPDKIYTYVYAAFLGLGIAAYVQYNFLNSELTLLGVSNDALSVSTKTKVINILIWLVIIFACVALAVVLKKVQKKEDKKNYFTIGFILYFALHLVSSVLLIAFAPQQIYGVTSEYFVDSTDCYTVSKHNNVIVIVFDCFDNSYIEPYYQENPDAFVGLKDFTLYTDTCSVYDSTVTSMSQMFGGAEFDNTLGKFEWLDASWNSEKTLKFYELLHQNNYECNGYNFEMPEKEYIYGKFDNVHKNEKPEVLELEWFRYDRFQRDFGKLALFRCLPYYFKEYIEFDGLSFREIATYKLGSDSYYMNSDYLAHLDLHFSDDDKNYLMINHINGTHKPCTLEEGIVSSFDIMNKIVQQLKDLGVYDSSTIIFTSDHGYHNEEAEFGWGATPLFMIKAPNDQHDSIVFTKTPEYHEDIMATIAYLTGIDQSVEPGFFGNTIYDFDENSVRTRVFYDRIYDEGLPAIYSTGRLNYTTIYNAYCKYEFTGPSDILYGKAPGSEGTESLPMTEYFG